MLSVNSAHLLPSKFLTDVLRLVIDSEPDSQRAQTVLRELRGVSGEWFRAGERLDRWTVKVWLQSDGGDRTQPLLYSNLSAIEKYCGQSRVAYVQLFAQADMLLGFREDIRGMLGDIAVVCPGIKALSIAAARGLDHSGDGFVLRNEHINLFQPFAADIVNMFPALDELKLDLPGYSCDVWGLGAYMVEKYAGQLRRLIYSPFRCSMTTRFSEYLTCLKLTAMPDMLPYLPCKVNAQTLEHLSLAGVPQNFDWGVFHGSPRPKQIIFERLRTLTLSFVQKDNYMGYSRMDMTDASMITFCFPRLEQLSIDYPQHQPQFIKNCTFPSVLHAVSVSTSCSGVGLVKWSDFATIDKLSIAATYNKLFDSSPVSIFDAARTILSNACVKSTSLALEKEIEISLILLHIRGLNLTTLRIDCTVNFASIMALLEKLPALADLHITVSKIVSNIQRTPFAQTIPTEHVNSGLQLLTIYGNNPVGENSAFETFLAQLTARLTTLKEIHMSDARCQQFADVIKNAGAQYPHLYDIKIVTA